MSFLVIITLSTFVYDSNTQMKEERELLWFHWYKRSTVQRAGPLRCHIESKQRWGLPPFTSMKHLTTKKGLSQFRCLLGDTSLKKTMWVMRPSAEDFHWPRIRSDAHTSPQKNPWTLIWLVDWYMGGFFDVTCSNCRGQTLKYCFSLCKKETVSMHFCISGISSVLGERLYLSKYSQFVCLSECFGMVDLQKPLEDKNKENIKGIYGQIKKKKEKKKTTRLPCLKFCTKIFLLGHFQLLPAAQIWFPHRVSVLQILMCWYQCAKLVSN